MKYRFYPEHAVNSRYSASLRFVATYAVPDIFFGTRQAAVRNIAPGGRDSSLLSREPCSYLLSEMRQCLYRLKRAILLFKCPSSIVR